MEDRAQFISNCIWHILRGVTDGKDYQKRLDRIGTAIANGASAKGIHQRLLNIVKDYEDQPTHQEADHASDR